MERNDEAAQGDEPATAPSGETLDADRAYAGKSHEPDRMPTDDEERAAERLKVDPEVARNFEAAAERGANVKGEGAVEG